MEVNLNKPTLPQSKPNPRRSRSSVRNTHDAGLYYQLSCVTDTAVLKSYWLLQRRKRARHLRPLCMVSFCIPGPPPSLALSTGSPQFSVLRRSQSQLRSYRCTCIGPTSRLGKRRQQLGNPRIGWSSNHHRGTWCVGPCSE